MPTLPLAEFEWPEWLFGNPWPIAVPLLLGFAALRLLARRLEKPALARVSWVSLALALLLIGLSQVVETTNRKLVRQTKELAAAAIGPQYPVLDRLLAPEVTVAVGDQSRAIFTGDKALRDRLAAAQVKTVKCSDLEAVRLGPDDASVAFSVQASGAAWEGAGLTTWRIAWRKTPSGWRAIELRLVNAPLGMMSQMDLRRTK